MRVDELVTCMTENRKDRRSTPSSRTRDPVGEKTPPDTKPIIEKPDCPDRREFFWGEDVDEWDKNVQLELLYWG